MRALLVFSLMAATMLAGCADEKPDADDCDDDIVLCNPDQYYGDHYCEKNDVRPRVYAPDTQGPDTPADPWVLGDSWTYSLEINGEDLGETQLIYYDIQDSGAHYMVGTPTREEALQHALFSTNPVIGRVHKTLYSPHESGAHADMFNFPLCSGNQWSDLFFDTPFTFTATPQLATLPDGRVDALAFRIDGTAEDGSTVTHTYSPMAKWFTFINLDRADGTTVTMQLTDVASGYEGTAYFLRGQRDAIVPIPLPDADAGRVPRDDIAAGYDTIGIWIDAQRTAGDGRYEISLQAPGTGATVACAGFDGSGLQGNTECPAPPVLVEVPFEAGEWRVSAGGGLLGDDGTRVEGEVRLVSIQDRSCTVGGNCGA